MMSGDNDSNVSSVPTLFTCIVSFISIVTLPATVSYSHLTSQENKAHEVVTCTTASE